MGKAGYSSPARGSQPNPYATTQILQSNSFHELAVDRPDPRWKASLQAQQEIANLGYSLTDRRPGNGTRHHYMWKTGLFFLSLRAAVLLEWPLKATFIKLRRDGVWRQTKAGETIYLHIHWKWPLGKMFLITLLSSSQFYPGSLCSPEMSPNHDALPWVKLISGGVKSLSVVTCLHGEHEFSKVVQPFQSVR